MDETTCWNTVVVPTCIDSQPFQGLQGAVGQERACHSLSLSLSLSLWHTHAHTHTTPHTFPSLHQYVFPLFNCCILAKPNGKCIHVIMSNLHLWFHVLNFWMVCLSVSYSPLCHLSLYLISFCLFFFFPCNINTHMPHTLHSFRACPHFHSSPSSVCWPDDLLQPVIMAGRSLNLKEKKSFLFLLSSPAFWLLFFFFCWAQKLHDDQKILPRVHCWIWMEEGRKRTCLLCLCFLLCLLKSRIWNINSFFWWLVLNIHLDVM